MTSHELDISNPVSSVRSEKGSALIGVLLLLLMITVLGVIAMKQGLTILNISTNAQVQGLLVQTSDAVLNTIATTDVTQITSISGVIGAALANAAPNQEYVFCYRPNFIQGKTTAAVVGTSDVVTVDSGGDGFCHLDTDYGSGRKATVTQVAVSIPTDTSNLPPLSGLSHNGTNVSLGSGLPQGFTTQQRVRVTATSMLPAFSASTASTIESDCLQGRISDNTDLSFAGVESVTDCLARKGVPANTQVQEFSLRTTLTGP
jgi:Tfp pilus assembly protein PilX